MAEQNPIFTTIGKKTDRIPVEISYKILELFSGGLYSSPTKAIEELVANSFDAFANWAHVLISKDLDKENAIVAVIDDGDSMDVDGLRDLWKIGESKKVDAHKQGKLKRLPIGKFGIGKLATWVLARQLTHICKQNGNYFAVTMFYSTLDSNKTAQSSKLNLDVRSLSEDEAKQALQVLTESNFDLSVLFSKKVDTWTATLLSNLKPMVKDLKIGRLEWVLSTAMPIRPDFRCFLNGKEIQPAKLDMDPINKWVIGKDDKVAKNLKLPSDKDTKLPIEQHYGVILPRLGRITGYAEVYENTLTGGKSAEWGRSHGFFVMVMGRLINVQDELFGSNPLSHKTFNRFRLVVNCDGLNDFLLSSREGIAEKDATIELRRYLTGKFNEVASWYENWIVQESDKKLLSVRLGKIPQGFLKRPIVEMVARAVQGQIPFPRLTRIPTGLTKEENEVFIEQLIESAALDSQKEFVNDIVFEALGIESPIAIFDSLNNNIVINSLHPFYVNYQDYFKNPEPFQVLGVAEILTEAHLYNLDMRPEDVNDVLSKRDNFLRELVYSSDRLSAPLVAQMLRDAAGDDVGLENALAKGFRSLGFDVLPLGLAGKPDGLATANLGVRQDAHGVASYSIAYDAKSTKNDRVQTSNVNIAGIARHRRDYNADFAVVVGKQFSDKKEENSAVVKEARMQGKITLIEVEDFALLIETASTKRLGLNRLRELFETCCSPSESRKWIKDFIEESVSVPPIPEILYAIYEMQSSTKESVQIADIKWQNDKLKKLEKKEIQEWLQSIAALVPEYISVHGDIVELQMHPDKVLSEIGLTLRQEMPSPTRDALLKSLGKFDSKKN